MLLRVALADGPVAVRVEAVRALGAFDTLAAAPALIKAWGGLPAEVRADAVTLLASRKPSAVALLTAMKQNKIARGEVTDNTVLKMQAFKDSTLNALIDSAWGRTRSTPAELVATIDAMRAELDTRPGDFARGKLVFEANCAKCHAFEGRGQSVGPALDGAGRDAEYILANVIDPNRVVGAPYFLRTLTTVDGRVEQGLLHEEDDKSITLKVENGVVKRFAKDDIEGPVKITEKSMMPEGLTYGMKPGDFRDLVSYLLANPCLVNGKLNGVPFAAPVAGRIALPKGGSTVEFAIAARADTATQLQVEVAGSYKLALDGRPVADRVTIPAGSHTLTVTVDAAGGALTVRPADPDRKLTNPAK